MNIGNRVIITVKNLQINRILGLSYSWGVDMPLNKGFGENYRLLTIVKLPNMCYIFFSTEKVDITLYQKYLMVSPVF